ncbi:MAG: hypothetical protein LBE79_13565, partial [Tannerella sp.]|nr:hypothetical protein [Tannerella sp.]
MRNFNFFKRTNVETQCIASLTTTKSPEPSLQGTKQSKFLSLMIAAIMAAVCLLAAMPAAAQSTINVSTLGSSNINNSGDSWNYIASSRIMYLRNLGNFAISGTNTNLRISARDVLVTTLTNVNLTASGSYAYPPYDNVFTVRRGATLELKGNNTFSTNQGYGLDIDGDMNIYGGGSLNVHANNYTAIDISNYDSGNTHTTLNITGSGTSVNAYSTSTSATIDCNNSSSGDFTINIGPGASLSASNSSGHPASSGIFNNAPLTLNIG